MRRAIIASVIAASVIGVADAQRGGSRRHRTRSPFCGSLVKTPADRRRAKPSYDSHGIPWRAWRAHSAISSLARKVINKRFR